MALPKPEVGLVIRYSYLWHDQAMAGQIEGLKDRPCAIVIASSREGGKTRVVLAPITHAPPVGKTTGIEVPVRVAEHLRLDGQQSWIVTSEINVFTWPGPDIRPAFAGSFAFGHLPYRLALMVRDSVLEQAGRRRKVVERDDQEK